MNVLFVVTSHDRFGGAGKKTGVWIDELTTPFVILADEDCELTLASIEGGRIPIEPRSEDLMAQTEYTRLFRSNLEALNYLANTTPIKSVKASSYDALVLPGGYGALWDFPNNPALSKVVLHFYQNKKPILSLSQGASALVNVKTEEGQSIVAGRSVTSSTAAEDQEQRVVRVLPIPLEESLTKAGARFVAGPNWQINVVEDPPFVSAQNSSSGVQATQAFLNRLHSKPA